MSLQSGILERLRKAAEEPEPDYSDIRIGTREQEAEQNAAITGMYARQVGEMATRPVRTPPVLPPYPAKEPVYTDSTNKRTVAEYAPLILGRQPLSLRPPSILDRMRVAAADTRSLTDIRTGRDRPLLTESFEPGPPPSPGKIGPLERIEKKFTANPLSLIPVASTVEEMVDTHHLFLAADVDEMNRDFVTYNIYDPVKQREWVKSKAPWLEGQLPAIGLGSIGQALSPDVLFDDPTRYAEDFTMRWESATKASQKVLGDFIVKLADDKAGDDWMAQVASGAIDLTPYALEFVITAGLAETAALPVKIAARKLLKKYGETLVAKHLITSTAYMAKLAVRAGVRGATIGLAKTTEETIQRMYGEIGFDETGKLVTLGGEPFLKAFGKAIASTFVSYFSEETGEIVTGGLKKVGGVALSTIPGAKKYVGKLAEKLMAALPKGTTTAEFLRMMKYDGLVGEIGEEGVERIIRSATSLDEVPILEALWPGWEQIFVEAMVLGFPGAIGMVSGAFQIPEAKRIAGRKANYEYRVKEYERRANLAVQAEEEIAPEAERRETEYQAWWERAAPTRERAAGIQAEREAKTWAERQAADREIETRDLRAIEAQQRKVGEEILIRQQNAEERTKVAAEIEVRKRGRVQRELDLRQDNLQQLEIGQRVDAILQPVYELADKVGASNPGSAFGKANSELLGRLQAAIEANDPRAVQTVIPELTESLNVYGRIKATRAKEREQRNLRKTGRIEPEAPKPELTVADHRLQRRQEIKQRRVEAQQAKYTPTRTARRPAAELTREEYINQEREDLRIGDKVEYQGKPHTVVHTWANIWSAARPEEIPSHVTIRNENNIDKKVESGQVAKMDFDKATAGQEYDKAIGKKEITHAEEVRTHERPVRAPGPAAEGGQVAGGENLHRPVQEPQRGGEAAAPQVKRGAEPFDPFKSPPFTRETVNPTEIGVHPKIQYKRGAGERGVTGSLTGVLKWNPAAAEPMFVWTDPETGKVVVVDGHQRLERARTLGKGSIEVNHIVQEAFADAKEARAWGGIQNIMRGNGTAEDAAALFRETGITLANLNNHGVSVKEGVAAKGMALSRLCEQLWGMVTHGEVSENIAVEIGSRLEKSSDQMAAWQLIKKKLTNGRTIPPSLLREIVSEVGGADRTTEKQGVLWGVEEYERNLAIEKAQVADALRKVIRREAKTFGFNASEARAEELTRAGNVIDTEANKAISADAKIAEFYFDKLRYQKGPLQDILQVAARDVAAGKEAKDVAQENYEAVRDAIRTAERGGQGESLANGEVGAGRTQEGAAAETQAKVGLFGEGTAPAAPKAKPKAEAPKAKPPKTPKVVDIADLSEEDLEKLLNEEGADGLSDKETIADNLPPEDAPEPKPDIPEEDKLAQMQPDSAEVAAALVMVQKLKVTRANEFGPEMTKAYQDLGFAVLPGVRLGDAEGVGRLKMLVKSGNSNIDELESYIKDLYDSNKVTKPEEETAPLKERIRKILEPPALRPTQIKAEQAKKEAKKALDDLGDYLKGISFANPIADPKLWSLTVKAVSKIVAAGVYKFADMVAAIAEQIGKAMTLKLAPNLEKAWGILHKADAGKRLDAPGKVADIIKIEEPEAPPAKPAAQVLAEANLEVNKHTSQAGRVYWRVTGRVFDKSVILDALGAAKAIKIAGVWGRSFWHADPTERIAALLEGRPDPDPEAGGGKGPRGGPGHDGHDDPDLELKRKRESEDARPDRSGFAGNRDEFISSETKSLIRAGAKVGIAEATLEDQMTDIAMINRAFKGGDRAFLLANAAGTGKTFVLGGALREVFNSGAKRAIYITTSQDLIRQIKADLAAYGILDKVDFHTYAASRNATIETQGVVLIFDEAQNIKNLQCQQGFKGQALMANANMTIFSSATPYENPVQAGYMDATGIFEPAGGHHEWAKMYGASVKRRKVYNQETGKYEVIETLYWAGGKAKRPDQIAARKWFQKQGVFIQRGIKLPKGMVAATFNKAPVGEEWVELIGTLEGCYKEAAALIEKDRTATANDRAIIKMHAINAYKRILEAAKVGAAIVRARELINEGQQVVIFTETKAFRHLGRFRTAGDQAGKLYTFPEMEVMMSDYFEQVKAWMRDRSGPRPRSPFALGIYYIAQAMYNAKLDMEVPSGLTEIEKAFADVDVAYFTGYQTNAQADANKKRWLDGKTKLMVATMAKGGTGLSLHDIIGDKPLRTQLGLNMPWTATQYDQTAARLARLGTANKVGVEWLFADNIPFERIVAGRVGKRMGDMGALVKGLDLTAADVLEDWNFEDGFDPSHLPAEEPGNMPPTDLEVADEQYRRAEILEKSREETEDKSGGFFETPYPLAVCMGRIAGVAGGQDLLDPSAGRGNLIRLLKESPWRIDAVEINPSRYEEGKKRIPGAVWHYADFMVWDAENKRYDTVLMNPPFEWLAQVGAQDVMHVQKAYSLLKSGGRLVAIMGEGAFFRTDRNQYPEFRDWLESVGATVVQLPEEAFKNSGTNVKSRMVIIDKGRDAGRSDLRLGDMEIKSLRDLETLMPPRIEPTSITPAGQLKRDEIAPLDMFGQPTEKFEPKIGQQSDLGIGPGEVFTPQVGAVPVKAELLTEANSLILASLKTKDPIKNGKDLILALRAKHKAGADAFFNRPRSPLAEADEAYIQATKGRDLFGGGSTNAMSAPGGGQGYGKVTQRPGQTFGGRPARRGPRIRPKGQQAAPPGLTETVVNSAVAALDELKKPVAPAVRGELARAGARILRHRLGELAHETEIDIEALNRARRSFWLASNETVIDFIDNMENGLEQPDPKMEVISLKLRELLDTVKAEVQETGKLQECIENYFPHIWKNPSKAKQVLASILGRRPLEGSKAFLKQRTILMTKDGYETYGLEPITWNPVDLVLLKVYEMRRYLMGQRVLGDLKANGLAKFVYVKSRGEDGWVPIRDPLFTVYMPPELPIKEAYDYHLVDQLMSFARALGIDTERVMKMARGRWGQQAGSRVTTKFAGPESVLVHEIGHILGDRYSLFEVLTRESQRETKTKGKQAGESVFTKEAKEERKTILPEWRALADMRFEDMEFGPGFRKYVRKAEEKEAVLLEAYIHAPHKFKQVAPTLFGRFEAFLNGHGELRPLMDIKTSLVVGTGEGTIAVPGVTELGKYWVPEPIGRILNNHLSPGLRGHESKLVSGGYNILRRLGNTLNQVELALSGFHALNTTSDVLNTHTALGLRQLIATPGQRLAGLGNLALGLSGAGVATNLYWGSRVHQAYAKDLDQITDPRLRKVIASIVIAGGRRKMDPHYYNNAVLQIVKNLRAILRESPWQKTKAALRTPYDVFSAAIELAASPILRWLVPRQKMGTFMLLAEHEMNRARIEGLTDEQLHERLTVVWDSIDNREGQLVYDNLFWPKTLRDSMMLGVRAVGWNVGNLREFVGGFADFATTKARMERGDLWLSHKTTYIIAATVQFAMMGAIIMYYLTGKPPEELKDYFFPKTGRSNPDGSPERLSLPTYAKDWYAYATRPWQTVKNKLHPLWRMITEFATNRDFYGTQVRNLDDPMVKQLEDTAQWFAKQYLPFSVRNYMKMQQAGEATSLSAVVSATGIQSAPGYISKSPAQLLMSSYIGSRQDIGGKTVEQGEKYELRRSLMDRARRGLSIWTEEAKSAFTDKQMADIAQSAVTHPFPRTFKSLPLRQALNVFEIASPKERELVVNDLAKKFFGTDEEAKDYDDVKDLFSAIMAEHLQQGGKLLTMPRPLTLPEIKTAEDAHHAYRLLYEGKAEADAAGLKLPPGYYESSLRQIAAKIRATGKIDLSKEATQARSNVKATYTKLVKASKDYPEYHKAYTRARARME